MKYLLLLTTVIISCVAVYSQEIDVNKVMIELKRKKALSEKSGNFTPKIKNVIPNKMKLLNTQQQDRQEEPGVLRMDLKGKYLGLNDKGDRIYAMTPDNMPCLVPGKTFQSNMPIAGNETLEDQLKRSGQRVQIIPLEKTGDTLENKENK